MTIPRSDTIIWCRNEYRFPWWWFGPVCSCCSPATARLEQGMAVPMDPWFIKKPFIIFGGGLFYCEVWYRCSIRRTWLYSNPTQGIANLMAPIKTGAFQNFAPVTYWNYWDQNSDVRFFRGTLKLNWAGSLARASYLNAEQSMSDEFVYYLILGQIHWTWQYWKAGWLLIRRCSIGGSSGVHGTWNSKQFSYAVKEYSPCGGRHSDSSHHNRVNFLVRYVRRNRGLGQAQECAVIRCWLVGQRV